MYQLRQGRLRRVGSRFYERRLGGDVRKKKKNIGHAFWIRIWNKYKVIRRKKEN